MEHIVNFDGFVEGIPTELKRWGVPGTALGIVKDGNIVYQGGFGSRLAGQDAPITEDTMFAIGSATKAFTAAAVAILVEDGVLAWDTPVQTYIPEFRMYDEFASRHVTIRDMLCHRTGIPRHEFMWYNASITRQQIFEGLAYLEPNCDLRTTWQYNNEMFAAIGYIIEKVCKKSWEQIIQTRIFDPLGMSHSNFSVENVKQYENAARPHAPGPEGPVEIPYCNLDAVGPAGAINSTLGDMLKWLRFQLSDGTVDGKKILSPENMLAMHQPLIFCQANPWTFPEMQAGSYALGWFVDIFRGERMVYHGGNINGFSALVGFEPDSDVGVVILSNLNNNFLNYALMYTLFDTVHGIKEGDWYNREKKEIDAFVAMMTEAMMKQTSQKAEVSEELDVAALKKYVGIYRNGGYGSLEITLEGEKLVMHYHNTDFELTHNEGDVFGFAYPLLSVGFPAKFHVNGEIADSVSIPFEQTVKDIVFTRV